QQCFLQLTCRRGLRARPAPTAAFGVGRPARTDTRRFESLGHLLIAGAFYGSPLRICALVPIRYLGPECGAGHMRRTVDARAARNSPTASTAADCAQKLPILRSGGVKRVLTIPPQRGARLTCSLDTKGENHAFVRTQSAHGHRRCNRG